MVGGCGARRTEGPGHHMSRSPGSVRTLPDFAWVKGWGDAAGHDGRSREWTHHGIALTEEGLVVTMAPDAPDVQILEPDGTLKSRWAAPVVSGHGLRVVHDGDAEALWVADNGVSAPPGIDGTYPTQRKAGGQHGAAVKLTLDGRELMRLEAPSLEQYEQGNYAPTDVAVDERHRGGGGDIWVADGYGQHLVHRFDEHGKHLLTLDGALGLGAFDQPHGLLVDRRGQTPELYITDRGNSRLQVFDLEGRFRRGVGIGVLASPGGMAVSEGLLYVSELDARISVLDERDELVGVLGQPGLPPPRPDGWPNDIGPDGRPTRPALQGGTFRAPHAIVADDSGSLYISEWLIGGRLTKLTRSAK